MRVDVGPCRRISASLPAALTALALLLVTADPARADTCPNADAGLGTASRQALADATLCLLNDERAAHDLGPLSVSTPLQVTASKYAAYMVSAEHFAHLDESGRNVVQRVLDTDPSLDGHWDLLGENLGWGTLNLATPRAMVAGWMASPEHRANVLAPEYQEIGVGVAQGAPVPATPAALTYTTIFAAITPPAPPKRLWPTARECRRARSPKSTSAQRARLRRACAARTSSALSVRAARG